MMKFVLFLILSAIRIGGLAILLGELILPIGCTTTSSGQLEQTHKMRVGSKESGVETQDSGLKTQDSYKEDKVSSSVEAQKPLFQGEKELKLAEPAPETLQRPWGGIWNAPADMPLPKSNPPEADAENIAATQKSPASLPKIIDEETRPESGVQSQESRLSTPDSRPETQGRRPWGGFWAAPLNQPAPSVGEETPSQDIETPPPASWDDYKEVDFGKFASGSYGSDYANKYVKIKCRFSRIGSEFVEVPKYPRPEYVTFVVTGVGSQLYNLIVVVPRPQADAVFKLKPQKEIVLYGKAVQVDFHTLTLEVRKIER